VGLFDRVERKLERVVNGAFAKAFKAEVQPVEIASAMRRAMDDRAAVVSKDRTLVPNDFVIELAPSDYDRLTSYEDMLTSELLASAQEHVETQRYAPGGPLHVSFSSGDDLETGVFRVRADTGVSRGHAAHAARAEAKATHEPSPAQPPRRKNLSHPREAVAAAEGPAGMARRAAGAAENALAGTAAARASTAAPAPRPATPEPAPAATPAATPSATPAAPPVAPPPLADPASRPWLDVDGDTYPLLAALTVLGRDATADITLEDPGISRRHAEIRVTYDGPHLVISIRDLGSTNGTYVNGEKITSRRLAEGDRITVGRISLNLRQPRR
jgi:hypothetical protein